MLFDPARPVFQGRELIFGESVQVLSEWLKSIDPKTESVDDGVLSRELGIYIHAEEDDYEGDDDDDYEITFSIDSVTVFKKPFDVLLRP